jgi:hypothetical protein
VLCKSFCSVISFLSSNKTCGKDFAVLFEKNNSHGICYVFIKIHFCHENYMKESPVFASKLPTSTIIKDNQNNTKFVSKLAIFIIM